MTQLKLIIKFLLLFNFLHKFILLSSFSVFVNIWGIYSYFHDNFERLFQNYH